MTKESRTRSDLDFAVHPVVLYDGVCGLCNRLVRFILRRDPAGLFQFASLQSAMAADILARHGADAGDLDTVYVVVNRGGEAEELLARSEAAIFILMHLGAAELCSAGQPRAAVPTDATPTASTQWRISILALGGIDAAARSAEASRVGIWGGGAEPVSDFWTV